MHCRTVCPHEDPCTYLLASFQVLRQFDLAHAPCTDCLSQRPCPGTWRSNGRPPLGVGLLHLSRSAIGSYSIDRHSGCCRRVRRIPCVASPARFCACRRRGGAVSRFAATNAVVCEVALLPITSRYVIEALLLAGMRVVAGPRCGALRAMRAIGRTGMRGCSTGGLVSHHRGRCWRSGRHGVCEVGRRVQLRAYDANRRTI
jgi:hypothetical protein